MIVRNFDGDISGWKALQEEMKKQERCRVRHKMRRVLRRGSYVVQDDDKISMIT